MKSLLKRFWFLNLLFASYLLGSQEIMFRRSDPNRKLGIDNGVLADTDLFELNHLKIRTRHFGPIPPQLSLNDLFAFDWVIEKTDAELK